MARLRLWQLFPLCLLVLSVASVASCCSSATINCGNLTLGYPFGVAGGNCGDPDFQIYNCTSQDPYIVINNEHFYVRNATRVSNPAEGHTFMELGVDSTNDSDPNNRGCFDFSMLTSSLEFGNGTTLNFNFNGTGTHEVCLVNCRALNRSWGSVCDSWSITLGRLSECNPSCDHTKRILATVTWTTTELDEGVPEVLKSQGFYTEAVFDQQRYSQCVVCWEQKKICGFRYKDSSYIVQCFSDGSGKTNMGLIVGATAGAVTGLGLIVAAITLLTVRLKRRKRGTTGTRYAKSRNEEDAFDSGFDETTLHGMHIFTYDELRDATDAFADDNEIGDGGFGSVFRGRLRDGRIIAVKRLYQYRQSRGRVDKFVNEASVFSKLQHPYVVRLYGCTSPRSAQLMLVFEYLPNGTLADHLHGHRRCSPEGLPWDLRLKIAAQAAEALAFLHSLSPALFHRDVKSSNILLDAHFDAKVADFGLCKPMPLDASHVTTTPQGTPGYVDPEYHECYQLTDKSDVYSYGVVLAEILSGKAAVDVSRERRFINLASMAVMMIQQRDLHGFLDEALTKVMKARPAVAAAVQAVSELAFRCLSQQRDQRPTMRQVADALAALLADVAADVEGEKEKEKEMEMEEKVKEGAAFSPTSVHDVWPSVSSTANDSSTGT